jgi:DNA segregation ATPase FtsK/SpoIIIE, S-DNA-T family
MSTDQTTGQPDAGVVPLRAVPAPAGDVDGAAAGTAVYADVTAPGERKPILPRWLTSRDAARHHTRRVTGAAAHTAAYHGVRSPVYLAHAAFWALPGVVKLTLMWVRWWLFPVPLEVYADAVADGHRAWHRAAAVHRETSKTRALISLAVVAGVLVVVKAAGRYMPWYGWVAVALAVLPVLARHGRPSSVRIVGHAQIPPEYEPLTQDVVTRALASLGLAGINAWLRIEGNRIDFTGPVREDGPGWLCTANLPYGVTVGEVIDRRDKLASGLRRPLGAVWPELVGTQHEGALSLWVGQQDVTARKPVPWPLLKTGAADVFRPVPFGTDVRGRKVSAPLIYHNWLIGSMPRNGKTGAVRELACAAALDPLAGLWIAELKGSGDLDPLERVSHRFVSGIDDDSIGYAAKSLALLRAECERRAPKIKALPPDLCPDRKVTRQIARRNAALRPIVCFIDEAQNVFSHPKHGKQAGTDAEFVIKVGPALGIVLVLATQRPDRASLPTGVSGNVSIRFCLYVAGQTENDMVLGTSAYKNGLRATMFRPEIDAGLGWLKGATPAPKVTRTHYLNVKEAETIAVRARAARERAGTLTGVALGEDGDQAARDPLADAAAVFGADAGLWWTSLATRLAQRFPDRWAGATADSVSAELRALGVPSVTVSAGGTKARGCRLDAIEAAAAAGNTPGQTLER